LVAGGLLPGLFRLFGGREEGLMTSGLWGVVGVIWFLDG
jgi:hypothetical protein